MARYQSLFGGVQAAITDIAAKVVDLFGIRCYLVEDMPANVFGISGTGSIFDARFIKFEKLEPLVKDQVSHLIPLLAASSYIVTSKENPDGSITTTYEHTHTHTKP